MTQMLQCEHVLTQAPLPRSPVRLHNKSNKAHLSYLDQTDATLLQWESQMREKLIKQKGLISRSRCRVMSAADGRFSCKGQKACFGYQLSAFKKFGRETMFTVASNKKAQDLTVSHLCGTRNCCNSKHLFLDLKVVNDERTHCHWVLWKLRKAKRSRQFLNDERYQDWCSHNPKCGSLPPETESMSQAASQILSQASLDH